jgi:hypothetical protein
MFLTGRLPVKNLPVRLYKCVWVRSGVGSSCRNSSRAVGDPVTIAGRIALGCIRPKAARLAGVQKARPWY